MAKKKKINRTCWKLIPICSSGNNNEIIYPRVTFYNKSTNSSMKLRNKINVGNEKKSNVKRNGEVYFLEFPLKIVISFRVLTINIY